MKTPRLFLFQTCVYDDGLAVEEKEEGKSTSERVEGRLLYLVLVDRNHTVFPVDYIPRQQQHR
jgi:hypothetical protein